MTAPLDRWFKSSFSNGANNNCVEVCVTLRGVLVRHSTRPDGAVLAFSCGEWAAFVGGVAAGMFDRAAG